MKEFLYRRMARELTQQATVGTSASGSLSPTEIELRETWQVNRHTVREALRELTERDLTSWRKGAGTCVCEPKADSANHPLPHLEDLLLLAKNNLRAIRKINEIMAGIELSRMIGCLPSSRWLHIVSTREDTQNPDTPICWANSYADMDHAKLRMYIRDDPHSSINDLIETHYGIKSHEAYQTITVVGVPKKVAEILNAAPGSPVVRIVRRYLDRDRKVPETMISIHPVRRYTCSIVLKLRSPRK